MRTGKSELEIRNSKFEARNSKLEITLLSVLLSTLCLSTARGTTLVRLSLEQLSQASTDIVRGHVVSQESRWNAEHTQIVTLTTIAVDQAMKGHPPTTLVIEQLGGTVGNIRARVAGTVHFLSQADYLLFLEPVTENPSRYLPVGMMQGAYRVYRDAMTHEERVIQPQGGFFYDARGSAGEARTSDETMPLAQFRQQLSTALSAPVVIPRGTSVPLTIESTESRGVGRLRVSGRTARDIYPNSKTVIPAGSPIQGTAQLVSGVWKIHWTEVSVRGTRVPISASSKQPRGESLRGRTVIVNVR